MSDTGGQYYKVDVINGAYSLLRISGLTLSPTPAELELALTRLENMAAEFEDTRGLFTNYNFEENPDPNSLTNLRRSYRHAYETNLAVRLISDFNKNVPVTLYQQASSSYSSMSASVASSRLQQVQYPMRMPTGSGNTLRWARWHRFYRETPNAPNSSDTKLMFTGDINDYVENFDAYLNDGEFIESFTIVTDPGLVLVTSSSTDLDVKYRIKANDSGNNYSMNNQQLTIVATTTDGRINTRKIFFNITVNNQKN